VFFNAIYKNMNDDNLLMFIFFAYNLFKNVLILPNNHIRI